MTDEEKTEGVTVEAAAVKMPLVYERLALVTAEMPAVAKDKKHAQGYNYRSVDAICGVVHDLFAKHKLTLIPNVISHSKEILDRVKNDHVVGKNVHVSLEIKYRLICLDDGSELEIGPIMTEGVDPGDKATFKATSMGLKYALIQLFTIPVQNAYDGDADGTGNPPASGAKGMLDAKKGRTPPMTDKEEAIIQNVAEKLFDSCPNDFHIDNQKIAAACYAYRGAYPDDPTKIGTIAAWLGKDIIAVCTKNTRT